LYKANLDDIILEKGTQGILKNSEGLIRKVEIKIFNFLNPNQIKDNFRYIYSIKSKMSSIKEGVIYLFNF